MSDSERQKNETPEEKRRRLRYAKRLAFGYACSAVSFVFFLTAAIGYGVTYQIFSGADCVMRVIFGMYLAAATIEFYMIAVQEWCTLRNVRANTTNYGCHQMSTHQFFMHFIALLASLTAIALDAVAFPNQHAWIVGVAAFGIGVLGMNNVLRLALIHSERERIEDSLAKLKEAPVE